MSRYLHKTIAALQLSGAVLTALLLGYEVAHSSRQRALGFEYLIAAYLFAACALGIWAGVLLWRNRPLGYKLSIATQALQVPLVMSSPLSYALMFGVGAWVYLSRAGTSWGVETKFRVGELYQFGVGRTAESVEFGVNVVACYIMYRLWRTLRKATEPS
jgi:hypothetical protein